MAEASGVTKVVVTPKIPTINEYLGFNDKNKNGTIEKASFFGLVGREGYRKDADINGDGSIVRAEAKYYIRCMKDAGEDIINEASLTDDDREELLKCFTAKLLKAGSIDSKEEKSIAIRDIAIEMASIDLFQDAVDAARTIEDPTARSTALAAIADAISDKNSESEVWSFDNIRAIYSEALDSDRSIKDTLVKAAHIKEHTVGMYQSHLSRSKLIKLFNESLEAAKSVPSASMLNVVTWGLKILALIDVGKSMIDCELGKDESNKAFKEALIVSKEHRIPFMTHRLTRIIQDVMVECKYSYVEITALFDEAGVALPK